MKQFFAHFVHVQNYIMSCQFSAPDGCLQYFTNTSGSIQSFNFKMEQSPYPANLDYAICIKPQQGFCGVHLATSTVGDGE